MFKFRARALILTGAICLFATWSVPVRSQEGGGDPAIEETVEEATSAVTLPLGNPEKAITTATLDIPVDELQLLVKPLTLEELQNEVAAWLLLVKDKAKEVSEAEVAIKRQNLSISKQEEAVTALTAAKQALEQAEAAQANANPGSPEYEEATKRIEEAKENLTKAQDAVDEASKAQESLTEDKALTEALKEAEKTGELETAKQVLEEAKTAREELTAGSLEYDNATKKIDALTAAIADVEKAQKELEGAAPDTPEHQEATQTLEKAQQALKTAREAITGSDETDAENQQSQETSENLDQAATLLEDTTIDSDNQTEVAGLSSVDSTDNLQQKEQQLEDASEQLQENADAESELKNQLVVRATELQTQQTALIDRFKVILDEVDRKGGDTQVYRQYIDAVSGINLDLSDTEGLGVRLLSWAQSEEGGMRWVNNFAIFFGIVIASVIISQILGIILNRGLRLSRNMSSLLRDFIVVIVKRGGIVVGVLIALMVLEVSLGPILALVGGASFVLAFALQSNIGNFASGLMLMVYKPFDVGDEVQIDNIWGFVDAITLGGTKILSLSNQLVTIPNNTVWSSIITNNTGTDTLGIEIKFQIGYDAPLEEIKALLLEICKESPLVVEDPEPIILPLEFRESAIHMLLLVFAKTEDRWTVRWELPAAIQERFTKEGIDLIDYQELHVEHKNPMIQGNGATLSKLPGLTSATAETPVVKQS